MKLRNILLAVYACCILTACASTTIGVLRSSSNQDKVFKACLQAAQEGNFGIISNDAKSGFISAEQAVFGGRGQVVRMNVMVRNEGKGTEVEVAIVPPPGTVGNIESAVNEFVDSLKKKVPDVTVVSVRAK